MSEFNRISYFKLLNLEAINPMNDSFKVIIIIYIIFFKTNIIYSVLNVIENLNKLKIIK